MAASMISSALRPRRPSGKALPQLGLHLPLALLLLTFDLSSATPGVCPNSCNPSNDFYATASVPLVNSTAFNSYKKCQAACIGVGLVWGQFTTGSPKTCYCYSDCNADIDSSVKKFQSFKAQGCPVPPGLNNDPHFVGARGTRFDFNGELAKSFCLIADKDIHINGFFDGYKTDSIVGASMSATGKGIRSWVREVGLLWRDHLGQKHSLHLRAKYGRMPTRASGFLASVAVDGVSKEVKLSPGTLVSEHGLTLTYVGIEHKKILNEEVYTLTVANKLDMKIVLTPASPSYQLKHDSEVHFDLAFHQLATSSEIHGVLGQTYRSDTGTILKAIKYSTLATLLGEPIKADGSSGYGFLDGTTQDYVSSGILKPDCKFAKF